MRIGFEEHVRLQRISEADKIQEITDKLTESENLKLKVWEESQARKIEFITKQEIAASKLKILSAKYQQVKENLKKVIEIFKSKQLLTSNQERADKKIRILNMFDNDKTQMESYITEFAKEIVANSEPSHKEMLAQKSIKW